MWNPRNSIARQTQTLYKKYDTNELEGYLLSQSIEIRSDDVKKVEQISLTRIPCMIELVMNQCA